MITALFELWLKWKTFWAYSKLFWAEKKSPDDIYNEGFTHGILEAAGVLTICAAFEADPTAKVALDAAADRLYAMCNNE